MIRRIAIVLMFVAGEATAQKDVADPREHFLGTILVCEADAGVGAGYAVDGFVVSNLARDALPDACPDGDAPGVELLDVGRYRANGLQAWIRR
ncbi:MAG: hypothetical protein ABWZ41_09515 [Burkholderiales bacterium]